MNDEEILRGRLQSAVEDVTPRHPDELEVIRPFATGGPSSRRWIALSVAAMLALGFGGAVVLGRSSDRPAPTVSASGAQAEARPALAVTSENREGADRFADAISSMPIYRTSDFALPASPKELIERSAGVVRGTVVRGAAGPVEERTLSTGSEKGDVSSPVRRLSVAVTIRVESSTGAASTIHSGEELTVLIPVYDGPAEFLDRAEAEFLAPAVDAVPTGSSLLVTVNEVAAGTPLTATPSGFGTVFLDGTRGVVSVAIASDRAPLWNQETVAALERAAAN